MYQLIAFDMDGTLLNSKKQITEENKAAIRKAAKEGKIIILNTGRCIPELEEYFTELPEISYVNGVNGAIVTDVKNNEVLYSDRFSIEKVKKILEIASMEDVMIQIQDEDMILQRSCLEQIEKYDMTPYQEMFQQVAIKWENTIDEYFSNPFPIAKINLYHTGVEARDRTKKRLQEAELGIEILYAEKTGLELSNQGVSKGDGLKKLCEVIQIPLEKTIVVGDADNDMEALKVAGLAVAMGNAKEAVKEIADVIVSDCDHGGCVEVVERYLQ